MTGRLPPRGGIPLSFEASSRLNTSGTPTSTQPGTAVPHEFRALSHLRRPRDSSNVEYLFLNSVLLRPAALPVTPDGDIAQSEFIPPEVEHVGIEAKDALARYARGRGNKFGEPVVD